MRAHIAGDLQAVSLPYSVSAAPRKPARAAKPKFARFRGKCACELRVQEAHGTHYVVLAYEVVPDDVRTLRTDDQHKDFCRMGQAGLLASLQVHPHVKAYFDDERSTWTAL
jgi:hypothetical protein